MNEPIQQKAPKPPGLIPKNVQSWLLIGLALVMVVIMWLAGGRKPQAAVKPAAQGVPAQAPIEVNETKIAELQNRIQELQREQLVAQNALAQQSRFLGAGPQSSQPNQSGSSNGQPPERVEDPIKAEGKKRDYLSLFASNVALSYRRTATNTQTATESERGLNPPITIPQNAGPDAAQLTQLLKDMQAMAVPQAGTSQPPPAIADPTHTVSAENNDGKEEGRPPAAAPSGALNAAAGKTYVIFEGTVLETVLINRLEGQFSGPVECLLISDVYSHDRHHLFIPPGTSLLRQTPTTANFAQTPLAVCFHR